MTTAGATWAGNLEIRALGDKLARIYPASCDLLQPDPEPLHCFGQDDRRDGLPPPLAWSFAAARTLGGELPADFHGAKVRWHELELLAGRKAFLLTDGLPSSVWARAGLADHECDPDASALSTDLAAAYGYLQTAHPALAEVLLGLAPNLVLARPRPVTAAGPSITSASLPTMPGVVWASRKIFRHIPPSTVSDAPLLRLAAENLLHEGVHQLVNLVLLTRAVLPPGYSARTSPRIPIAWRRDQDVERNKRWELDRVLHATAVYIAVVHYRAVELATLPSADDAVLHLKIALPDAVAALDYLSSSLLGHADAFDRHGIQLVRSLRGDAERAIEGCGIAPT